MRALFALAAAVFALLTAADSLKCRSHKKTIDHATGKESEPDGAAGSEQCDPGRVCSLTVTREDKRIEISQGCAIDGGQLCYYAAEEKTVICSCKTMNCNSAKVFVTVPERAQALSENLRKIGVTYELGADSFELALSANPNDGPTETTDPGAKKGGGDGGGAPAAVTPAGTVTKPPSEPASSKSANEDATSGVMTSTSSLLALLCAFFRRFF